jgi:hypothetical protein
MISQSKEGAVHGVQWAPDGQRYSCFLLTYLRVILLAELSGLWWRQVVCRVTSLCTTLKVKLCSNLVNHIEIRSASLHTAGKTTPSYSFSISN